MPTFAHSTNLSSVKMKKLLLSFSLLCAVVASTFAQNASNMTLLGSWDDPDLPVASPGGLNLKYSGCWGMAINGHEYAILGGAGHILVFDVTNPATPLLVKKIDGGGNTVWREFKSYRNYVYAVSDGLDTGLKVIDFSGAPDNIELVTSDMSIFQRAHTITLDTLSGHIYLNGGSAGNGIILLDASVTPTTPTLLVQIPSLPGGYIHDSYVRNDTLYASSGYSGLWIYDFKTNPLEPTLVSTISTGGYNHNCWPDASERYMYYTEEIPKGRPVQIVDLENLANGEITLVGNGFLDELTPGQTGAIPHNVYVRDNVLFNSQYEDGLLAYNLDDPTNPVLIGYYDTHPQNSGYNTYYGNWGNYPWLPSGNIIAGDMQNGLFVLKLDSTNGIDAPSDTRELRVSPNPATDWLNVEVVGLNANEGQLLLINAAGQIVRTQVLRQTAQVPVNDLPAGVYQLEWRTNTHTSIKKVVLR
jgi:choice-of-anchor B domain-containing protein